MANCVNWAVATHWGRGGGRRCHNHSLEPCPVVHCGRLRFSSVLAQNSFSLFSGHKAPISKITAHLYNVGDPITIDLNTQLQNISLKNFEKERSYFRRKWIKLKLTVTYLGAVEHLSEETKWQLSGERGVDNKQGLCIFYFFQGW